MMRVTISMAFLMVVARRMSIDASWLAGSWTVGLVTFSVMEIASSVSDISFAT